MDADREGSGDGTGVVGQCLQWWREGKDLRVGDCVVMDSGG